MSNNFYLQSADTSSASVADSRARTTSIAKSDSPRPRYTDHYGDYGDYDEDDDDDDNTNALPFPIPLARNDFLAPTFEPSAYLSSLAASRYQTLEDLRGELRGRSQLLSQELLDLVNAHHDDFTGLGRSLRGGDERVEEVRVGVLGFRREVEDVLGKVAEREAEVDALVAERVRLRDGIELARRLLDLEERVALMEGRLGMRRGGAAQGEGRGEEEVLSSRSSDEGNDDDDEDDGDADEDGSAEEPAAASVSRVKRRVQELRGIEHLADRVGRDHPFVKAQQGRISGVRDTLLLDLAATLKQLRQAQGKTAEEQLRVLDLYGELGASAKGLEVLKS